MNALNKNILVVTDNGLLYTQIKDILKNEFSDLLDLFDFRRTKLSQKQHLYTDGIEELKEINVKQDYPEIIKNYSTVISLHCKQIFPDELVKSITCINIHPGYNPYNRGWYPQVFAIINKVKLGATIHIMDEYVDHGPIIARQEVVVESHYTSKEAYEKVLQAELDLFRLNIRSIVQQNYKTITPEFEGDYHSIKDYNKLCNLDLNEKMTLSDAIDKLRALTHGAYKNAYFIDKDGNKIFVKIELSKE